MSRTAATADDQPALEPGEDWIVRRAGSRERRWFRIHALIRGLFWLIPFVIVYLIWVYWFEVGFSDPVPLAILGLGLLLLLFFLLWGVVYPRKWEVAIGLRDVMVTRGILATACVFVSYDRVQQIDRVSSPVMSRFHLTELVLHSAAGGVRIYALDPADADLIERRVRANQPLVPLMHQ